MPSLPLRRTLGLKLGLAFAAVLAVMLASLGLVLIKSSNAAEAYERAIAWKDAVAGASEQAAGTRQQQASQALYVATGEATYKARVAGGRRRRRGRRRGRREAQRPARHRDRPGGDRRPTRSTTRPSTTSSSRRWSAATPPPPTPRSARPTSYVRIPLRGAGADRGLREPRQKPRTSPPPRPRPPPRAASASSPGCSRRCSPSLIAVRRQPRHPPLRERGARPPELAGDATTPPRCRRRSTPSPTGDLTQPIIADTPAIANPGSDELGDIARATNGIRDPPARVRGLLQRHAPARSRA